MKKTQYTLKDIMAGKSPKSLQVLLESNLTNTPEAPEPRLAAPKSSKSRSQKEAAGRTTTLSTAHALTCCRFSPDGSLLLLVEQLSVSCPDLPENDALTLKAFNLESLHKLGHAYAGASVVHLLRFPFERLGDRFRVDRNIVQVEWAAEKLIAALCGDGEVLLVAVGGTRGLGTQVAVIAGQVATHRLREPRPWKLRGPAATRPSSAGTSSAVSAPTNWRGRSPAWCGGSCGPTTRS